MWNNYMVSWCSGSFSLPPFIILGAKVPTFGWLQLAKAHPLLGAPQRNSVLGRLLRPQHSSNRSSPTAPGQSTSNYFETFLSFVFWTLFFFFFFFLKELQVPLVICSFWDGSVSLFKLSKRRVVWRKKQALGLARAEFGTSSTHPYRNKALVTKSCLTLLWPNGL